MPANSGLKQLEGGQRKCVLEMGSERGHAHGLRISALFAHRCVCRLFATTVCTADAFLKQARSQLRFIEQAKRGTFLERRLAEGCNSYFERQGGKRICAIEILWTRICFRTRAP